MAPLFCPCGHVVTYQQRWNGRYYEMIVAPEHCPRCHTSLAAAYHAGELLSQPPQTHAGQEAARRRGVVSYGG